jgi:serine/threonine-protein kinase RsbW
MNTIAIEIPSLLDNVRIVESFIDNVREKFNLNDDVYGNIMIAVTESVSNAIVHGNRGEKSKNVHLQMEMSDERISFSIRDEGKGFDYLTLPDPTSPENIEKAGGRGIFLMRHLADEVHFRDEGRCVELTFFLDN